MKPAVASMIVTDILLGATTCPGVVALNKLILNVRAPVTEPLLRIGTVKVFVPFPFVNTSVPVVLM